MSTKITDLPSTATVATTDIVPVVILSGPTTKKATVAALRTAMMPVSLTADVTGSLPAANGGWSASTAEALTNKTISGASNTITVRLASDVSGTLPVANGGTGVTSLTLPASGLVAGTTDAQTLTGKTISGASNTLTVRLASDVSGTLPVANGGTGITSLGSGVATFWGTPSSANLAAAVTDETGSGSLVFGTSPTISAPTISSTPVLSGASTSTSNNAKGTAKDVNPVNVQTTDATLTTLDSFTIASNSAVAVSWLVTGIKSDSSAAGAYSVSALFKNAAGTVVQVGTTAVTVIGETNSAWDCTADNSTTTIRLRVTGVAATTIQWTAILTSLTVIP